MTRNEIMAGLKELMALVKPKLDLSGIGEDSNLITDMGLDSLSMLLLSLGIENKFSIQLPNQKPFQTVSEVIDCVAEQLPHK